MEPLAILKQGMTLVVLLSAPALIAAVLAGVLISLVQGMMQIQDQTLPFGIKLLAVSVTLAATARWVGVELIELANHAFEQLIYLEG
ncbi:type III secretion system export apparatus subunit SctS [Salinicola avicenniae]|uniref:type III secretion system export apparatus subunit SctS n=1 Tax=Salinicola avicenniae TaxID=2916836 RepID=UPI002073786D|nr:MULTISPECIES: type III secretion system export apparatus subunit SctS [unclassified Salinicola]